MGRHLPRSCARGGRRRRRRACRWACTFSRRHGILTVRPMCSGLDGGAGVIRKPVRWNLGSRVLTPANHGNHKEHGACGFFQRTQTLRCEFYCKYLLLHRPCGHAVAPPQAHKVQESTYGACASAACVVSSKMFKVTLSLSSLMQLLQWPLFQPFTCMSLESARATNRDGATMEHCEPLSTDMIATNYNKTFYLCLQLAFCATLMMAPCTGMGMYCCHTHPFITGMNRLSARQGSPPFRHAERPSAGTQSKVARLMHCPTACFEPSCTRHGDRDRVLAACSMTISALPRVALRNYKNETQLC
jgi:hypothetical protein